MFQVSSFGKKGHENSVPNNQSENVLHCQYHVSEPNASTFSKYGRKILCNGLSFLYFLLYSDRINAYHVLVP